MSNRNGGKIMFAGILGALAGAIGGLLFAPKSGSETRDDILKLANLIADQIKTGVIDTEKRTKEVFGKATKDAVDKYNEIKTAVVDKVAAVKSAGEDINKEKYSTIVEDVLNDFRQDFESSKTGYEKMLSLLKKDWEKVKKALMVKKKTPKAV